MNTPSPKERQVRSQTDVTYSLLELHLVDLDSTKSMFEVFVVEELISVFYFLHFG